MSHDLSLAQNHACNLARTLMMPFKADNDEYGVRPEDDLDGIEVDTLCLHDLTLEPSGSLYRLCRPPCRNQAAAGKGG